MIHSNPLGSVRFFFFFFYKDNVNSLRHLKFCTLKASLQNDKCFFFSSLSSLCPTADEMRWGQESRGLCTTPGCGCWNCGPPTPGRSIPLGTPVPALPCLRHPHPVLPTGKALGIAMAAAAVATIYCNHLCLGAGTQLPGRLPPSRACWELGREGRSGKEPRMPEPH